MSVYRTAPSPELSRPSLAQRASCRFGRHEWGSWAATVSEAPVWNPLWQELRSGFHRACLHCPEKTHCAVELPANELSLYPFFTLTELGGMWTFVRDHLVYHPEDEVLAHDPSHLGSLGYIAVRGLGLKETPVVTAAWHVRIHVGSHSQTRTRHEGLRGAIEEARRARTEKEIGHQVWCRDS